MAVKILLGSTAISNEREAEEALEESRKVGGCGACACVSRLGAVRRRCLLPPSRLAAACRTHTPWLQALCKWPAGPGWFQGMPQVVCFTSQLSCLLTVRADDGPAGRRGGSDGLPTPPQLRVLLRGVPQPALHGDG